jgi:hypothetical protein
MMGTEMVPDMSVIFNQLTFLIACQDFLEVKKDLEGRTCGLIEYYPSI